jgi:hypothetical protein
VVVEMKSENIAIVFLASMVAMVVLVILIITGNIEVITEPVYKLLSVFR